MAFTETAGIATFTFLIFLRFLAMSLLTMIPYTSRVDGGFHDKSYQAYGFSNFANYRLRVQLLCCPH